MKRAELLVTLGGWSSTSTIHPVAFDSVEIAKQEFDRISALLKKRADKGNDVPKFLDIKGINELSCDFDRVNCISLIDLAKANEHEKGLRDEYPHIKFRPD